MSANDGYNYKLVKLSKDWKVFAKIYNNIKLEDLVEVEEDTFAPWCENYTCWQHADYPRLNFHIDSYMGFESWVSQPRRSLSKDYTQEVELKVIDKWGWPVCKNCSYCNRIGTYKRCPSCSPEEKDIKRYCSRLCQLSDWSDEHQYNCCNGGIPEFLPIDSSNGCNQDYLDLKKSLSLNPYLYRPYLYRGPGKY
jgi:hypothetical protein